MLAQAAAKANADPISLFALSFDPATWKLAVASDGRAVIVILLILAGIAFLARRRLPSFSSFDIDRAEIGVGSGRISFKPNDTDRQVAYAVWVELSTRKIGLPIDLDDDVIAEVYDSWYGFFAVTRELIKSIPATKVADASTGQIVGLSIQVLNQGLRPHLTKWQARFRRWYERRLAQESAAGADPQQLQKEFPQYPELSADLLRVNGQLVAYRRKMAELVYGRGREPVDVAGAS